MSFRFDVGSLDGIRHFSDRLATVAAYHPEGIGHLVSSDTVHKRLEAQPLDDISRQGTYHGQTNFLGDVIGRTQCCLLSAQSTAAVT